MSSGGLAEARSKNVVSATTLKPMETLKGIFSMPKMDRNRRNFLRENKLSLRELQRVTNKNKMQQQQEQVQREQKYAGRRANSQQRNNNNALEKKTVVTRCPSLTRVPSGRAIGGTLVGSFCDVGNHHSRRSVSRTNSTTTVKSVHKQVQTEDIQDEQFLYDALKRCTTNERYNGLQPNFTPGSHYTAFDAQSRTSFYPAAQVDEEPGKLDQYEEYERTQGQQYNAQQQDLRPPADEIHATGNGNDVEHYINNKSIEHLYGPVSSSKYNFVPTPRSQQHYSNGYNMVESDGLPPTSTMQSSYEPPEHQHQEQQSVHYRMQPNVKDDAVRKNFENMGINNGSGAGGDGDGPYGNDVSCNADDAIIGGVDAVSISARSRRTNFLQQCNTDLQKKRSTGSIHKIGSRDNLNLPRYLEREKREKEEQRQQQSEHDPNCPPGHYPLSDKERQEALHSAERRFKTLINELNHMPMTTETLRMRLRKAEIEKELKLLETDIRVFSKTKVYVKHKE
ncbi:uncharacterized protein [Eurosta solidaginis]|uniref:uncharacterized protein isoform X2 n=1 Tax=Eurosta solidaginis TaxID=178769 RepID=UPI003530ABA5